MTKIILVIFWVYLIGAEPVIERQEMEDFNSCNEIAAQLNTEGHFAFCGIEIGYENE